MIWQVLKAEKCWGGGSIACSTFAKISRVFFCFKGFLLSAIRIFYYLFKLFRTPKCAFFNKTWKSCIFQKEKKVHDISSYFKPTVLNSFQTIFQHKQQIYKHRSKWENCKWTMKIQNVLECKWNIKVCKTAVMWVSLSLWLYVSSGVFIYCSVKTIKHSCPIAQSWWFGKLVWMELRDALSVSNFDI